MDWFWEHHVLTMAHFARMNGNVVTEVVVVHNNDAPNEAAGVAFLKSLFGAESEWLQCSYNSNIRKQYPGVGYTYDPVSDVFVTPRPFPSWVLDANHDWQAPVPKPEGINWVWNETTQTWDSV